MDWSRNAYDGFYAVGLGLPDGFAHKFVHIYRAVYKSNNQSRTFKIHSIIGIPLELLVQNQHCLHQNQCQWTKDCRLPPFQVSYHRKAARAPRPGSISTLGTLVTHTHYYQQAVWPQKFQKKHKLKKKDGSGHQRDNGGVWTTTGSSASKKGPPPSPPASRMSSAAQFGDDSSSGSGGGPAVTTERVDGGATSEEAAASPSSPFSAAVFADPEQLLRRANFKKMRVYQTTGWHHDTAEVGCVVLVK